MLRLLFASSTARSSRVIVRVRLSLPVGYKTACLAPEGNYVRSARVTLPRCTLPTICCDKTGRGCRSEELSFGNGEKLVPQHALEDMGGAEPGARHRAAVYLVQPPGSCLTTGRVD